MPDKTSNTADLAESTDDAEFARKAGDHIVEGERVAGEPASKEPATNKPFQVSVDDADIGLTDKGTDADDIPDKRRD